MYIVCSSTFQGDRQHKYIFQANISTYSVKRLEQKKKKCIELYIENTYTMWCQEKMVILLIAESSRISVMLCQILTCKYTP